MNYLSLKLYFKRESVLELGLSLGYLTKYLVNDFSTLDLVESSKGLLNQLLIIQKTTKHNLYFKEFKTYKKFDTIRSILKILLKF
ncbi:MAG TPA: hypothetical protein DF603_13870 [Chryseobacterium sp.]|nr:hypothetical protein [Chryseobacterium sp.]